MADTEQLPNECVSEDDFCPVCYSPLSKGRTFCSLECSSAATVFASFDTTCYVCGVTFVINSSKKASQLRKKGRLTCSRNCARSSVWEIRKQKLKEKTPDAVPCTICGKSVALRATDEASGINTLKGRMHSFHKHGYALCSAVCSLRYKTRGNVLAPDHTPCKRCGENVLINNISRRFKYRKRGYLYCSKKCYAMDKTKA
jgi:hypothetical protein